MASVPSELWRRFGLKEATPARALETAARCLYDLCAPRWAAALSLPGGAPVLQAFFGEGSPPAALLQDPARLSPREPAEAGEMDGVRAVAIGLWPHGTLGGALVAGVDRLSFALLAALREIRAEAEVAFELAEEAEELRRSAPSPEELGAMRQRTLQRLWHELMTPVALLRAAHEQLRLVETDEAKQRPLKRIGTAAERLGHLFDLLNDILWAREAPEARMVAGQLAESLVWLAESQLQVE